MAIADIIKYEGDNSTFIWKHPCEDFNSLTQLIVHESQEAVFMMNGQALDLFGPGRYTLETQNIPMIGKSIKKATDGETPFHCEVYFINKTVQMGVKWGTDSKVRFLDPNLGIPIEIGACGEMNLQVLNSRKLLVKLVGTMNGIAWEERGHGFTKSIQGCFRPLISTAVKTNLPTVIKSNQINILEIDEHLDLLSASIHEKINAGFEEFGLTIPHFYVTNVLLPENDPYFKRMRDLHTVSFQTKILQAETFLKTAQADADAEVTAARRKVELERQTTATEIAKREAERDLIRAQTEAQSNRMAGLVEAEIMAAKGYNQKDVLQAQVQMAYAEGIGNMGANGGGGGGMISEFVNLGVGMAAMGNIGAQMGNMFNGFGMNPVSAAPAVPVTPMAPAVEATEEKKPVAAKCAKCGAPLPENAKFCFECGEKVAPAIPEGMVMCPDCKNIVVKGKFCPECGHKFVTTCPKCGATLADGAKFCFECGEKI